MKQTSLPDVDGRATTAETGVAQAVDWRSQVDDYSTPYGSEEHSVCLVGSVVNNVTLTEPLTGSQLMEREWHEWLQTVIGWQQRGSCRSS